MTEAAKPFGRPTVYSPEMLSVVIECGKVGMGLAEIAAELGITRVTLYAWEQEKGDFFYAMLRAREASLSWWNRQGRIGIWDQDDTVVDEKAGTKTHTRKRLNSHAYSLQVRNRFPDDWRDKREDVVTVVAGGSIIQKLTGAANAKKGEEAE